MKSSRHRLIRSLFNEYIKSYASRDNRLTERFSDNFSGYTAGGAFIVGNKKEWVAITRQDFSQVPDHIRIEMLNLFLQDLSDDVVLATALFNIHLPIPEPTLSRESVRLTLVFRQEEGDWKIAHSGISVPYPLVHPGEVFPIRSLYERNHELDLLLNERTQALEQATRKLDTPNPVSHKVHLYLEPRLAQDLDIQSVASAFHYSRRTLTRRLREEGTSFLQIKDRLRRTAALQLLIKDRLAVETIAVQIGFSDLSNFYRSFKKWTGTTPLAYQRERH